MFIDVGASIGEFAITMANDPRVSNVLAFEPHPQSRDALAQSAHYAPPGKIEIISKGVSFENGLANFDFGGLAPTGAGIRNLDTALPQGELIEICTLDDVARPKQGQAVVLLIDIEGGELDALRGGLRFIQNSHPLIIFEYNNTTRKFFPLSDAVELLGSSYSVFRMRSDDGRLDDDLSSTWNVVALPHQGPWDGINQMGDLFDKQMG